MVKGQHPQAVKEAIATILPIWLEAFKVLLSTDPQADIANAQNWDALAVRIQVFKVSLFRMTRFNSLSTALRLWIQFTPRSLAH
jgi:hypothetical protein